MAAANFTDWDPALKEVYDEREVKCLSYGDNVLLGLFEKKKDHGGKHFVQAFHVKGATGASASLAVAKTNNKASKFRELNLTRVSHFQRISIELQLLLATSKSEEAFVKAKEEFDTGFEQLSNKFDQRLFRGKSGSIGQIAATSSITTDLITLTDKADSWNFEEGDMIAFSSTDGGGTLRDSGDVVEVESVDPMTGIVTIVEANLGTEIASVAVGDYIFMEGDHDACMSGLEDWLPVTDRATKLAASFFGMVRTAYPVKLGGVYLDATALGLDANGILVRLVSDVVMHGKRAKGKPDLVICPWDFFKDLQQIWLSKKHLFENIEASIREPMEDGSTLVLNKLYPGMMSIVGGVKLKIIPSRHCPSSRLYCLKRDTWTIHHVGRTLPMFPLEEIEGQNLRVDDTVSGQTDLHVATWLAAYGNLGCSNPGANGVAKLPTL